MAQLTLTADHSLENSVSLDKILSAFDGPLNEEQAWAVCYQCAQFLKLSWPERNADRGCTLDGAEAVRVHKDGSVTVTVHEWDSLWENDDENTADFTDEIFHTEAEMVNALGRIVYHALDYGCHEEEERVLSEPLEELIDQMTNTGEEGQDKEEVEEDRKSQGSANTDEGIVDGHESDDLDDENSKPGRISTFEDVLQFCSGHLLEPEGAPTHYQAVCRALLAEVNDLTSFLRVIASSKKSLQRLHAEHGEEEEAHLEDIQPKQWARIWMQVLQQLRQGVKLKEISDASYRNRIPIEYELTPYEILMDDIRSHKYTLREVLVPQNVPHPLRTETLYERLLRDIRSRPPLAPASSRVLPDRKAKPKKKKKSSKARPRIRHQSTSEGSCASSVDSEDLEIFDTSPELPRKVLRAEITLDWSDEDDVTESDASRLTVTPRNDDSDLTPQPQRDQLKPFRRLETLNAPSFDTLLSPDSSVTPINDSDIARDSDIDEKQEEAEDDQMPKQESPRRHSIAICQTLPQFSSHPERYIPPECLALTVDEVIHIRSVLVKAEIENLRVNPKLHNGVLREKICFSCKKKFALFKRKSRCKLCKRLICSICTKKMYLPRGHFLQIPIESLSPTSPKKSPAFGEHSSQMFKSHSEPPTPSVTPEGSPRLWRRERQTNLPKEQLDTVCCECKDFLKEAVRASQQASRINGTSHQGSDFKLNSPPRLPKQCSHDSQHSEHSTQSDRSTHSNRSTHSDRSPEKQRRHSSGKNSHADNT
ncbi:protein spire homolog 1-like isoform X2 [Acanthaster planci]|uniref:Protein spire homolog 1-like isoform X2 n=1 Tax=Acanthaster planci TaxID=133434 RepID=A0A8B7YHL6_ACAPL|nr:protein spire homolog 1-like isoform X2 [Acanthaster planci]